MGSFLFRTDFLLNKTLISTGIITLLGLSACGGDSPKDVTITDEPQEVVLEEPFARVVFNPATADLNIPNDFLMIPSGNFFDFTLNTPIDKIQKKGIDAISVAYIHCFITV